MGDQRVVVAEGRVGASPEKFSGLGGTMDDAEGEVLEGFGAGRSDAMAPIVCRGADASRVAGGEGEAVLATSFHGDAPKIEGLPIMGARQTRCAVGGAAGSTQKGARQGAVLAMEFYRLSGGNQDVEGGQGQEPVCRHGDGLTGKCGRARRLFIVGQHFMERAIDALFGAYAGFTAQASAIGVGGGSAAAGAVAIGVDAAAIVMGGRCIVTTAGRRVGAAKYKARGTGVYFHDEVACGFGACGVKCCSSCVIRCAGGEGDALIELDDVLYSRLDREVIKVESGPGIPIQATACQAIAEAGAGGGNQVAHADDFT